MAPAGQGSLWAEVLCCTACTHLFSLDKQPINLPCGHTFCKKCVFELVTRRCPLDQVPIIKSPIELPVNVALLSVLDIQRETDPDLWDVSEHFLRVEKILVELAGYLRRAESDRGGSVWSEVLSRPVQRKLITLLCYQLLELEGQQRALRTARALVERVLTELVIQHQSTSSISLSLWSAVRARGCQFLGPAMQEEVLRLILLTLSEGAMIARKTLVMYIVRTLGEDYPQVSKTCVGHVVQLLYRASCFNVLKREGESSLMQLKVEFRSYDALRREHDSQIVQVAMEAGLRISPDQWSSLLYGDQSHRSHMQSIIDKLQSPQAYEQMIAELLFATKRNSSFILATNVVADFEKFSNTESIIESSNWTEIVALFESLARIVSVYVVFMRKRKIDEKTGTVCYSRRIARNSESNRPRERGYKTRLCRDIEAGRLCARGQRCTYAHSEIDLRPPISTWSQHSGSQQKFFEFDKCSIRSSNRDIILPNTEAQIPKNDMFLDQARTTMYSMANQSVSIVPVVFPTSDPKTLSMMANISKVDACSPPDWHDNMTMMASSNPLPPPPAQSLISVWPHMHTPHSQPTSTSTAVPHMCQYAPASAFTFHSSRNPMESSRISSVHYSNPMDVSANYIRMEEVEHFNKVDTDFFQFSHSGIEKSSATNQQLGYTNNFMRGMELENERQLFVRKSEILMRLENLHCDEQRQKIDDSTDDDDLQSHVSYTVANSVLFEEKDVSSRFIDFPSIPLRSAHPTEQIMMSNFANVATLSSNVPLVCAPLLMAFGAEPATVQAPCAVMHLKDTISQPLPTPAIQRSHGQPMCTMFDRSTFVEQILPLVRSLPVAPSDPQNVVNTTLDRIVDVRERLNDANKYGGTGSSVEKQQLNVELNIVSRQIQVLDDQTKKTCLLRELKEVDKKIGNLTIGADCMTTEENRQ